MRAWVCERVDCLGKFFLSSLWNEIQGKGWLREKVEEEMLSLNPRSSLSFHLSIIEKKIQACVTFNRNKAEPNLQSDFDKIACCFN